jgi:uncharacterized membrane protein
MRSSHILTLLKTITWRITGSGATFAISYIYTGSTSFASGIALTQMVVNSILYYVHERIWNYVE